MRDQKDRILDSTNMRYSIIDNPVDTVASRLRRGFTLVEVMTAVVILAFVCSSVFLVINRSIMFAANSSSRMEAFRIARENMEKLLLGNSVSEMTEYGVSESNPSITWTTVVETFTEPATGQAWARAVCSADYVDPQGETQTVELVQWLSPLSDEQTDQLPDADDLDLNELAVEQLLEYVESAAQYAEVEPDVIEQWLSDGLVTTDEGAFIKYNLDIFSRNDGNPTDEQKAQQVASIEELADVLTGGGAEGTAEGSQNDDSENVEMTGGPTGPLTGNRP